MRRDFDLGIDIAGAIANELWEDEKIENTFLGKKIHPLELMGIVKELRRDQLRGMVLVAGGALGIVAGSVCQNLAIAIASGTVGVAGAIDYMVSAELEGDIHNG